MEKEPKGAPADTSQRQSTAWRDRILFQIKTAMTTEKLQAFDKSPVVSGVKARLDLKTTLGAQAEKLWWRLCIDPKDWNDALDGRCGYKEPQLYYDKDNEATSLGFSKAMEDAYKLYLLDNKLGALFAAGSQPMTWDVYNSIWQNATRGVGTEVRYFGRFDSKRPQYTFGFETCVEMSSGVYTEQIVNTPKKFDKLLVADVKAEGALCAACSAKVLGQSIINTALYGEELKAAIDQIFINFQRDILNAKLRKEQLLAIARCIRDLHVIHAFADGCGRTNVFLILPAMLMQFGFGLPLAGSDHELDAEHGIDRDALYFMFNGGFSTTDIARFLWVKQDFGMLANAGFNRDLSSLQLAQTLIAKKDPNQVAYEQQNKALFSTTIVAIKNK